MSPVVIGLGAALCAELDVEVRAEAGLDVKLGVECDGEVDTEVGLVLDGNLDAEFGVELDVVIDTELIAELDVELDIKLDGKLASESDVETDAGADADLVVMVSVAVLREGEVPALGLVSYRLTEVGNLRNIVVVREPVEVEDHEMRADKAAVGSGVYCTVYVDSDQITSTSSTSGFHGGELNNFATSFPYTTARSMTL